MPGGLLPPPTKVPIKTVPKKEGPSQKQIKHEWSYIVFWYEELRRHNPGGGFGPQALGFEAIRAYRDLFTIEMDPWELDTLLKMDMRWFKTLPTEKGKRDKDD